MIKLIDYRNDEKGKIVFINKSCIGGMIRNEQEGLTRLWDNGVTECAGYDFKETSEEILAMPDIEVTEKVIDWEQRRYEIAKEISGYVYNDAFIANDDYTPCELIARDAIKYADALIDELKKGGEK